MIFLVGRHVDNFLGQERPHPYFLNAGLAQNIQVFGRDRLALGDDDLARRRVGDVDKHVMVHQCIAHRQLVQHPAIRRFDKPVFVDATIGRQTTDEADVRPFRRLDGADSPIVAVMNVPDLEARALAAQTTRT